MATMVPKDCVDSCPIAQVLYKNLYTQLGSGDRVVQQLASSKKITGSLFWVQHRQRSLFVYLASSVESNIDVSTINQAGLSQFLENPEVLKLLSLQKSLLPEALHSYAAKLIPFLVLNPYAKNTDQNIALKKHGLYFSGKETIKSSKIGMLIYKLLGVPASALAYDHIRYMFNPEIILDTSKSKRLSSLKDNLLDNEQEVAMKADIVLHSQNRRSNNCNLFGVNGGVNSGKSEILLQRAKLIRQSSSDSNVIIITSNHSSQEALKKRFQNIASKEHYIEIFSFNEWCKQQIRPDESLIDEDELEKIINSRLKNHLDVNDIDLSMFLRELDFIYGRKIFYENEYLSTFNLPRPYKLTEKKLHIIWKAHLTLKNELSVRNYLLPLSFPQLLLDRLQENPCQKAYDHILVDDGQLLPPIAYELFKVMLKPVTGQLFIVQNTKQSAVNHCKLWKDSKLDLRGESIRLVNHYEINPAIINASYAFSINRLANEAIYKILPISKDLTKNPLPQLLHFYSEKDEENRLLNELKKKIHAGEDLTNILLISSDEKIANLIKLISETLNVPVDLLSNDASSGYQRDHQGHQKRTGLGLCSFSKAQGLTASYVYIFGLQAFFNTEKSIEAGTSQCQIKLIENTQLISMLMTQAKKELSLFITAEKVPKAFISPHIDIPTDKKNNQKAASSVSYLRQSG